MDNTCRLDIWLYAAHFFKTRQLAVAAIKNGRVLVNHARAKPARNIQCGDCIFIHKQAQLEYEVIVREVAQKRAAAVIVKTFYQETENSVQRREQLIAQQKLAKALVSYPESKPDKRARRQIRAIRHHTENL